MFLLGDFGRLDHVKLLNQPIRAFSEAHPGAVDKFREQHKREYLSTLVQCSPACWDLYLVQTIIVGYLILKFPSTTLPPE